jgi:hypothetical protein
MKRITLSFLSIFFLVSTILAGNENTTIGGRASAMGGAAVTLSDFWAINNNQAGLAELKKMKLGFYFENRFLSKELSYKALAFALPTKSGVFGVNYSHFGYSLYSEQKVGLAYAKSFGKRFSAGLQLDYLGTSIADNYGNKSAFTFELGVLAKLTNNVTIGVHLFNPVNAKFNDYNNEKIPSVFKLGFSYLFSEKLLFAIETEKNINYNPIFKAGIDYKIISFAYLRLGISNNPTISTFGFGVDYKQFTIDFSSSVHQIMGYSPQFSLIYTLK